MARQPAPRHRTQSSPQRRLVHARPPADGASTDRALLVRRASGISDHIAGVLQDSVDGAREDGGDDHGRSPLLTTGSGWPPVLNRRDTMAGLSRPWWRGVECPYNRTLWSASRRTTRKRVLEDRANHPVEFTQRLIGLTAPTLVLGRRMSQPRPWSHTGRRLKRRETPREGQRRPGMGVADSAVDHSLLHWRRPQQAGEVSEAE